MLTLYNVISADGYIADKNGSEDFIPDSYWPHTLDTLKQFDRVIIGRKTHDAIEGYGDEMCKTFDALPMDKVVVTRDLNFNARGGYRVVHTPEEAIDRDTSIVVTSGPTLNDYLLEKKLVDRIIFHKVPIVLRGGLKPYSTTPFNVEITELPI